MWCLESIHATNLCSFLQLDYSVKQGEATLIFGNNQDSDSQNSNGSGKSALIEAIAISLTGETLRKVNMDEIINDSQDEATISAILTNKELGRQLTINRKISRKQPQVIQILEQTGPCEEDVQEIPQPTVNDYNKYILDQLGLSKDDIFGNYILTARKYKSFLSSPDKDKKELINRISNAQIVDVSIEELNADIVPVSQEWDDARKEVLTCQGRVDALSYEIEKAKTDAETRKADSEERIKGWEADIAEKRAQIRRNNERISSLDDELAVIENVDNEIGALESEDIDVFEALAKITTVFKEASLSLPSQILDEVGRLERQMAYSQSEFERLSKESESLKEQTAEMEKELSARMEKLVEESTSHTHRKDELDSQCKEIAEKIDAARQRIGKFREDEAALGQDLFAVSLPLKSTITCPKCAHEFIVNSEKSVEELKAECAELQDRIAKIQSKAKRAQSEVDTLTVDEKRLTAEWRECCAKRADILSEKDEVEANMRKIRSELDKFVDTLDELSDRITSQNNKKTQLRKSVFDEAFEVIDAAYKRNDSQDKTIKEYNQMLQGSIESLENAILTARDTTVEDTVASLEKSLKKHKKALKEANSKEKEVSGRLEALKSQVDLFVEFKTYLANSKIKDLGRITNEFLAMIGSDIRISFSGFTILKSGKVRDKISVSLLRNGMDCGSFEKFSAGERLRVELASVLSINQLLNCSCDDGKGLDLLVADEVLDCADELGLASVFKALNDTHSTSLIVSHGNVAEGYPNKLVVNKLNGVSYIDHGN